MYRSDGTHFDLSQQQQNTGVNNNNNLKKYIYIYNVVALASWVLVLCMLAFCNTVIT